LFSQNDGQAELLLCVVETTRLSPGRVRVGTTDLAVFNPRPALVCRCYRALGHARAQSPQRIRSQDSRRKDADCRHQVTTLQ